MASLMWGIAVVSLIGTVGNIYKRRWSFALWTLSSSVWCIYDFWIGAYAQSALFAVYFVLAIWGLVRWRKEARGSVRSWSSLSNRPACFGEWRDDEDSGNAKE